MNDYVDVALRNFQYRMRLPENERKELDEIVEYLRGDNSEEDRKKKMERLEQLLNSPNVRSQTSETVEQAARRGFYGS